MSQALYEFGGLRFWNESEIELRELFQSRMIGVLKRTLFSINPAWSFFRVEGPILTPGEYVNSEYSEKDIFLTNHCIGNKFLCLRPETTASSYTWSRHMKSRLPVCVYQVGKSFRRELNDGATAAKLRFNEFWQLEFQCIYSKDTKVDYRASLILPISNEIERFTQTLTRTVDSERIPAYSESTKDIEALLSHPDDWMEVASCSIRTDYDPDIKVCEIAIGLDRIVEIAK